MRNNLVISDYLDGVHRTWRTSRNAFPKNVVQDSWPIPFFGNPANAVVATVGVNPSSTEFAPDRGWQMVKMPADWKRRLRDYFVQTVPSHEWFEPWRFGLALLDKSYERGTAAHFDVSYRPTIAMLKNQPIIQGCRRCTVRPWTCRSPTHQICIGSPEI